MTAPLPETIAELRERIMEVINYDPLTGFFTWKVKRGPCNPGDIAGAKTSRGYTSITVLGRHYRAHRLAWLISYGKWPVECTDHINGARSDNRLCNLRECTKAENAQNLGVKGNRHGATGVYIKESGNFSTAITVGMRRINLGSYGTVEEAGAAYLEAKAKYHSFSPSIQNRRCRGLDVRAALPPAGDPS